MKQPLRHVTLALVLILGLFGQVSAQGRRGLVGGRAQGRQRYYSITIGTGLANYFGDLATTKDGFTSPRQQFNLGLRVKLSPMFSVRGELQYYHLEASDARFGDASRKKRNLSFTANNYEGSVVGQFDLVKPQALYNERFSRRQFFNAYAFAGFGFTTNNPKTEYNGSKVALRPLQLEGVKYGAILPVIPLGIGVRIRAGISSDILLEYGYRIVFSDYLDDVSGKYADRSTFPDPVSLALSDRRGEINPAFTNDAFAATAYKFRGNGGKKDAYAIFSIKYQYTFTAASFNRLKRGGFNRRLRTNFSRYK